MVVLASFVCVWADRRKRQGGGLFGLCTCVWCSRDTEFVWDWVWGLGH